MIQKEVRNSNEEEDNPDTVYKVVNEQIYKANKYCKNITET